MIIGIDPDLEKSGLAVLDQNTQRIEYSCLSFVALTDFIKAKKYLIKCVYLEAGWLNAKSSWHGENNLTVASRVGKNVGENHATGKILQQVIEHEGVKVILARPRSKKLNADQFKNLTKIETRTNQETRDAIMLIWGRF